MGYQLLCYLVISHSLYIYIFHYYNYDNIIIQIFHILVSLLLELLLLKLLLKELQYFTVFLKTLNDLLRNRLCD